MQVETAAQLQQFQHEIYKQTNFRKAVMTLAYFIGEILYNIITYSILSLIGSRVVFYAKRLLYKLFKLGQS